MKNHELIGLLCAEFAKFNIAVPATTLAMIGDDLINNGVEITHRPIGVMS